jgi:stage II sporulation protein D
MTNWSFAYYGGFDIKALASGKLQVINVVNLEDYIKGVIPAEMSSSWPVEALKAQAMCARNYVINRIGYHGEFDVCDTTECQVYDGTYFATATTDSAVDATSGKFVLYNDKPCSTFFYSSNGGASESSENVWVTALPYLVGKIDEYETGVDALHSSWTFTYTAAEITDLLKSEGYTIGTVKTITPTYTAVGNILSINFSDGKTTVTVKKQAAGNILFSSRLGKYTYSQRFTITGASSTATGLFINSSANPLESIFSTFATGGDGSVSKVTVDAGKISVMTGSGLQTIDSYGSGRVQTGATFVVKGSGWGHNVGMSQYGAKSMALVGKSYVEIIKYYFTGVTIA